ncbi:MAG: DUF4167 domain-containing protein [Alphaproteobacteria bacterium]|nr:DUF4167 domain-containing protein [Alphaproteobacteria bacterium]
MKKVNNRYRNNNSNNAIYSLNYKFDSNSIAGKISGTALDLIKRYNDLAKEAHSNNDYVTAEIFRQYAEHYRKIVTEINERKQAREQQEANDNANAKTEATSTTDNSPNEAQVENQALIAEVTTETPTEPEVKEVKKPRNVKKSFHVIEINKAEKVENEEKEPVKAKRVYRRKTVEAVAAQA